MNHYNRIAIEAEIVEFVPHVKGCRVQDHVGCFTVKLEYRWWAHLIPGAKHHAKKYAEEIIRDRHTVAGLFMGCQ